MSGDLLAVCRPDDVQAHPARIVVHTLRQKRVEDTDQFAADRYDRLFSFQRILLPCRVIPVYIAKLGIAPNQRQNCLKEDLSQFLPPALADGSLTLVLAGAVLFQFQLLR